MPLTPEEAAHARSIVEPAVVAPIPPVRTTRVLIASPVRKPLIVVQQFLKALSRQRTRGQVAVDYLFAPNFSPTDADGSAVIAELKAFTPNVWENDSTSGGYADGTETRQWGKPGFTRLANLKNRILQHALTTNADFVWLVDTDVMPDPGCLQSLLDAADWENWKANETTPIPIVAGVYWTNWQRQVPGSHQRVHAGPQVWLTHPYGLSGRGWTEQEFRASLIARRRVRVWGLGACTLIPIHALKKGVSFAPFDGLPPGPMSEGEDRHFCAHADSRHVGMFADAWSDIYHAYHPADYNQLAERVDELDYQSIDCPTVGTLVSGKLELLEPVADGTGRWMRPSARWLRGTLGTLPVLPQVEEALSSLKCGQSTLIKLHFPSHWPHLSLRLQSRIARVTLFDAKPFRVAPTIDEELFVSQSTHRYLDTTAHTARQLDEVYADTHQQ